MEKKIKFKVLDIEETASPEEAQQAFKRLAMQLHPDREGGDKNKFVELVQEYNRFKNLVCPMCSNTGKVTVREGYASKTTNCPNCWGEK